MRTSTRSAAPAIVVEHDQARHRADRRRIGIGSLGPIRETNGNVIDTAFFDEDIDDSGGFVGELYYMAVLPTRESGPPLPPQTGGLVAAYAFNESSGTTVTDLLRPRELRRCLGHDLVGSGRVRAGARVQRDE